MNDSAIKYFRVDAAPAWVQFDAGMHQEPVLLEPSDDVPGRYSIRLKAGQFQYSGTPTGPGKFKVELQMGTWFEGEIISTNPTDTADGENSPPEIEFILQAQ